MESFGNPGEQPARRPYEHKDFKRGSPEGHAIRSVDAERGALDDATYQDMEKDTDFQNQLRFKMNDFSLKGTSGLDELLTNKEFDAQQFYADIAGNIGEKFGANEVEGYIARMIAEDTDTQTLH